MRLLIATILTVLSMGATWAGIEVDPSLIVLVIRHGEKPSFGDNLTCQGENRARQLPALLSKKYGKIERIYVPSLVSSENKTLHSRMFQTATPTAIRYGLQINSQFSSSEPDQVALSLMSQRGTVLVVWNHSAIPKLVKSLGIVMPLWKDDDFDSILVISFPNGKALLTIEAQQISPSQECFDR